MKYLHINTENVTITLSFSWKLTVYSLILCVWYSIFWLWDLFLLLRTFVYIEESVDPTNK